ncbi:hypothetical protein, partial [Xanthomonas graminis]|uniref:hypothetical protein n=1 Tax=Xanthomonas graminis TaxID=3390026 RepID=UPI001C4A6524
FSRFEKLDVMFLGFLSFVLIVDGTCISSPATAPVPRSPTAWPAMYYRANASAGHSRRHW